MINLIDLIPPDARPLLETTGVAADGYLSQAMAMGPGVISLPRGKLNFAQTVNLHQRALLRGEDGGLFGNPISVLSFAPNVAGVVVCRDQGGPADGSEIEGVTIWGGGGNNPDAHGIQMYGRAVARNCNIRSFSGNGVHISGQSAGGTNANGWRLDQLRIHDCNGHGVHTVGSDSNAGLATGLDIDWNRGWGIYDKSFLGNTYVGCTVHACTLGAYKTENNANSRNAFLGCYGESGQPQSVIDGGNDLFLGGIQGNGITGAGQILVDGIVSHLTVKNDRGVPQGNNRRLDVQFANFWPSLIDLVHEGNNSDGWMNAWQLAWWEEAKKAWQWRYKRSETALELTTDQSPMLDEAGQLVGGGELILSDGFYIPVPYWGGGSRYRKISLEMLKALPVQ